MNALFRLRWTHAALAISATAAYLTGESGVVHAWLGYGVAGVLAFRLALAFGGAPQLGLFRFYPHFEGLRLGNLTTHPAISRTLLLGIALSLVTAASTGIVMDRGRTLGIAAAAAVPAALADDDGDEAVASPSGERRESGRDEGAIGEVHETAGNLLALLVGLHIAYLMAFKRPLALFMLFLRTPRSSSR